MEIKVQKSFKLPPSSVAALEEYILHSGGTATGAVEWGLKNFFLEELQQMGIGMMHPQLYGQRSLSKVSQVYLDAMKAHYKVDGYRFETVNLPTGDDSKPVKMIVLGDDFIYRHNVEKWLEIGNYKYL